jgi:L-ascorbate metabolism protein UlaG (beta-lactamase superfamily)
MAKAVFSVALAFALSAVPGFSQSWPEGKTSDRFDTGNGELEIVFLGHGSLILVYKGSYIYIDPVSQYGDFSKYPKADLILVTHEHGDHLDPKAIAALSKNGTRILLPEASRKKLGAGEALQHGRPLDVAGVTLLAVAAYNVTSGRMIYHPRDRLDNGYVITSDSLRVYVAGDTEPIPEMANLGHVDIAFLPMNQPYTMTPEQAAAAARVIKPKILYPYHFGSTDTGALTKLLANDKKIEVRIRNLQ